MLGSKSLAAVRTLTTRLLLVPPILALSLPAAAPPAEFTAAAEKARARIPLGGDFRPDPKQPAFVAVGHGGRILVSRDDGRSWQQTHFGHPGSDHSAWATKAVTYAAGVFVVPIGWGAPTMWLASEDGVRWRHLTAGKTTIQGVKGAGENPAIMAGTWGIAGGEGVFVSGGYMTMSATPDFGKSFTTFSLRSFKDDPRPRKLVTHHVEPVFCGPPSGRFLALGNDRSKQNTVFGNLFASDDRGRTWRWLEPALLNAKCDGYSAIAPFQGKVVIADKTGANVFVSADAGDHWEGPFPTGAERAALNVVGDELWMIGTKNARASTDGRNWRDLPTGIPGGKIIASDTGALINIDRRRASILRSDDRGRTWREVHSYEPPDSPHIHGAQGLRDIAFGHISRQDH